MAESGPETREPSMAPEAQDPRFASGIPRGSLPDPETFVRLSGLVRMRQGSAIARSTTPAARPPAGAAASTPRGPSGPAASEEMNALIALQRLESNSRLLEAEQLLHALEKQPRDVADTVPSKTAPLLPKGIMIGRRERRAALPLSAPEEESAAGERSSVARLVRLLVAGILFAVVCWVLAYYLIGFVRRSVLPDLLDTWSPGTSKVLRDNAGSGNPPPSPGPAPQVREEINPPLEPAP